MPPLNQESPARKGKRAAVPQAQVNLTVLMPCKDQREDYFVAAVRSVMGQSFRHWKLLICVDADTPSHIEEWAGQIRDIRIRVLRGSGTGLAAAVNLGMREADSEFVCLLLSDDRLLNTALATLEKAIEEHPEVDFFHSYRAEIDYLGKVRDPQQISPPSFSLDDFVERGSPVKHLLCWRRSVGLAVGGLDENLSLHGCDDYDFPWTVAQAGYTFRLVPEVLYQYRVHRQFSRLTTDVPVEQQLDILRAIFVKHGVAEPQLSQALHRAMRGYLLQDSLFSYEGDRTYREQASFYWEISPQRASDFAAPGRLFFPHRLYHLPKAGPDGLRTAVKLELTETVKDLWEVVLFADDSLCRQFPTDLFFDDEVVWHQQHFGRPGQVASADLVLRGERAYGYNYLSDLVQRIGRRRQHKTQIENRLRGWPLMLFNALLHWARQRGVRRFYSASAQLSLACADPARRVDGALFQRIYDAPLERHFKARREGDWWVIDVAENLSRVVIPRAACEWVKPGATVAICHDTERGLGHGDVDPDFARHIDGPARLALPRMLEIEDSLGVRTTYNVLGQLWAELQAAIRQGGHALAFHSYDHGVVDQLHRCRVLDYRLKGYRPPRSSFTRQQMEYEFCFHNFEWIASSFREPTLTMPRLEGGLVKIPVALDDFPLHQGECDYPEWERRIFQQLDRHDFLVLGLHDAYAHHWLDHYPDLLRRLGQRATFRTLDEISAQVVLSSGL